MLLGQNVNSYGKLTPGELSFAELLAQVDVIDGLRRIRFTTSHPQDLSPELIEDFATLRNLCEHLHLPVQSGSDTVLARMRRGYTKAEYLDRLYASARSSSESGAQHRHHRRLSRRNRCANSHETLELLRRQWSTMIFTRSYIHRGRRPSPRKFIPTMFPTTLKRERLKNSANVAA